MSEYDRLTELLANEPFPLLFTFKFVGKNSAPFHQGVQNLETKIPALQLKTKRVTQNQLHISFTYSMNAAAPEEIVEVYKLIAVIPEVTVVL